MNRYLLPLLIIINLASCLKFAESDLDPNSPFSNFLGLSRLQNPQRLEMEAKAFYRVNGVLPTSFPFLTIHKIEKNLVEGMNLQVDILADSEGIQYFGGYSPDLDGSFRIHFPKPGFYRWNFYQLVTGPPQEFAFKGSGLFEVKSIGSIEITNIREYYLDANQSFTWDRIQAVPFREKRFNAERNNSLGLIGYHNSYGVYTAKSIYPSDQILNTSGYKIKSYPAIHIINPQRNWKSYLLENIPLVTEGSPSAGDILATSYEISQLIPSNSGLSFIIEKRISSGGNLTYSYTLCEISLNSSLDLSFISIQPRNSANNKLELSYVRPLNGGMVYREENTTTSQTEFRWDSNFLKPGSTNTLLSDAVGDFFESGNIPASTEIFAKDGILITRNSASLETAKILRADLTTLTPFPAIVHDSLFGANIVFYSATSNAFGMYESFFDAIGSPSNRFRITPYLGDLSLITSTGINLTGGRNQTFYSAANFQGSFGNENRTIFQVDLDVDASGTNPSFVSWNHSNGNYAGVTMKALSEIQTLEGNYSFTVSGFIAKNSCFMQSEVLVCVRKPQSRQTLPVTNNFDSYDSFFTTSTDGTNWSAWERLPSWVE